MQQLTILVICILSCALADDGEVCVKSKESKHSRLKDYLMCDYDKEIRPKLNQENATMVHVKMVLKYVKYEMHSESITVGSWLALIWKDEHLVWKLSEHDDIESMSMASDNLWVPDLSLYNGADTTSHSVFSSVNCQVYNTGNVICITPVDNSAICHPDLSKYPFDEQVCTLRFGSWIHSGEEINFKLTEPAVSTEDYEDSGEWILRNVTVSKHTGNFSCCPKSTFPSLYYQFRVARQSGSHVCMIIIPALVLIVLTMITFCTNPGESERWSIILVNQVIHVLFIQFIYWQLPISGPNPPLIIIYTRDSLVLATFTLVLTVVQKKLLITKKNSPIWISAVVASVANSRPGQLIFVFDDNFKEIVSRNGDEDGANIIENVETQKNKDWVILTKMLDRICFIIYFIIYFFMFIAFIP